MKKPRGTLKDYFKKGAIPKESDFADLIDSMLVQDEDSVFKSANNALSVVAVGDEEELLGFYRRIEQELELNWQVKQRPGGTEGKAGLSIHDAGGARLFVESGSGNIGIGTTTPSAKLQVSGGDIHLDGVRQLRFSDEDTSNKLKIQFWTGYGLGINPSTLFYAANGVHSWRDNNGANERMRLTTAANGGLTVSGTGNSSFAGNLGVGTTSPGARLEVVGGGGTSVDFIVNGRMRSNNNDGGLWISDNRFVGGHSTNQIGFWNGNAWRFTVLNNGNIGIGTNDVHNPQGWNRVLDILGTAHARLNVRSSGGVITSVFSHDDWGGARGVIGTESNHPLTFATNYNHQMSIDTSGNLIMARPNMMMMGNTNGSATGQRALLGAIGFVGIGASHAQMVYRAGISGSGGFEFVDRSKNGPALNDDNTGWARVSGILNNASSRQWKDRIEDLPPEVALAAVDELRPVTFHYTNDETGRVQAGFIAEEVPAILAAHERNMINPLEVVAVLTSVVQTQQRTIAELHERLNMLEEQHRND